MYFVFDGPDGGGKSSAIRQVIREFPQIKHMPRASDSVDGPVPNLDKWVNDSVSLLHGADWSGDGIFDRHPLISELIYGPIIRHKLPGQFNDPTWLRMRVRELANRATVVWCIPPVVVAQRVLAAQPQMAGVIGHYTAIHSAYVAMRAVWPGQRHYSHDYTTDPTSQYLLNHIRSHMGRTA